MQNYKLFSKIKKNMSKNQSYDEFIEKFKPKRTTDDCFTPVPIYNAVLEWLQEEQLITEHTPILRPFWPGEDYTRADYPEGCVVVDNPPFSIFAQNVNYYVDHGIRFFLFAPSMTSIRPNSTYVAVSASVTYQNGAVVGTSFVTNLYPDSPIAVTAPTLYSMLQAAEKKNAKQNKKQLNKLSFPPHVLRASDLQTLSRAGIRCRILPAEARVISQATCYKKGEYGNSIILSTHKAAELKALKNRAAERLELNAKAKAIVAELDNLEIQSAL